MSSGHGLMDVVTRKISILDMVMAKIFDHLNTTNLKFRPWSRSEIFDHDMYMTPRHRQVQFHSQISG